MCPDGLGVRLLALPNQSVETQCQCNEGEERNGEQKPRLEDLNLQIVHGHKSDWGAVLGLHVVDDAAIRRRKMVNSAQ